MQKSRLFYGHMFSFKTTQNIVNFIRRKNDYRKLPYSLSDIRDAVEQITNIDKVIIRSANIRKKGIYGQYALHHGPTGVYSGDMDYVEIMYDKELNLCWQRLVVCKELCHALIDEGIPNSGQRVETREDLENVVRTLTNPEDFINNPVTTSFSEILALPMALAILCPIEDREKLIGRIEDIEDPKVIQEIAEVFRIPVVYVPIAFSSNGIALSKKIVG